MQRVSEFSAAAFGMAALLCVTAYLFPYFYFERFWWRFLPSTAVILGTGLILGGGRPQDFFGISMSKRALLLSAGLCAVALPAVYFVLSYFVGETVGVDRTMSLRWQLGQFFQVLNDEMVMRAALLTVVLRAYPHPRVAIPVLAAVFSAAHRLAYATDGSEIHLAALTSLFAFGVIGNTLFVRFGHIGYGTAAHYAWNFFRFNTRYSVDGRTLRQGETFDYIEGSSAVLALSTVLMLAVVAIYLSWARKSSNERDAIRRLRR